MNPGIEIQTRSKLSIANPSQSNTSYCTYNGANSTKLIHINLFYMVEAAGVEPASETTFNRERSCFSAFHFVSSSTLRTGEETLTTSLIDLACSAQTEQFRPAYCATIGLRP